MKKSSRAILAISSISFLCLAPLGGLFADDLNLEHKTMTATGNFDVQLTPQKHDTIDVGRITIQKKYEGDMVGEGRGQMLSHRTSTDGSAGYVAMEHFTGSVDGRQGSFTLMHTGVMVRGEQSLDVVVLPDSGTEELRGIDGTLQIDIENGEHSYRFDYQLGGQD